METRLKVKGKFSEEMKAASIFFLRNTYSLNSRCLQERICSFQECLEGNSSKPLSLRLIWMYVENRRAGFYTHTCEKEKNMGYFSIVLVGDFLIKEFCIWYLSENWPGA